jgi:hypothetical protein
MRASMSSVSGLIQSGRMIAVQQNRTMTSCYQVRTTAPYGLLYYVKNATANCSSALTNDPQVEMEAPIFPQAGAPTGTLAPPPVSNSILGFTPLYTHPSFNSRGLPCTYSSSSGNCTANVGFIRYFKDDRIGGVGGWAAISVSPAGRIKRWFWNGSSWAD